jgi:hypothetical protein
MKALHEVADFLLEVGGQDIVWRPHGLYEISVRRLGEDEAEQATRNVLEGTDNDSTAD